MINIPPQQHFYALLAARCKALLADPTPAEAETRRPRELHETRRKESRIRHARESEWARILGPRYAPCRFENFDCTLPSQSAAVTRCRKYVERILAGEEPAPWLVLHGGVGTGKDHLAVAVCRELFEHGPWKPVAIEAQDARDRMLFVSGADLQRHLRQSMFDEREAETHDRIARVGILILSDPAPSSNAAMTAHQANTLLSVVDRRYRECRPIITTINAKTQKQFNDLLTAPVADRLIHDAILVSCDWASHRKPNDIQ